MSRTIRRAYTKSKKKDKSCRNSGKCPWCRGNRYHKHNKQITLKIALEEIFLSSSVG